MSRRPHPDGGPDIRDDEPLSPPFPVGTRLRMKPGPNAFDVFVQDPTLPVEENRVRVCGAGMEVTVARTVAGRRGTGRLMQTDEDGYQIFDSTKDGYSVYVSTNADGREIPHSGRAIAAEDAADWEVIAEVAPAQPSNYFSAGVLAAAYADRNAKIMRRHVVSSGPFKVGHLGREEGEALCNRKLNLVDRGAWEPVERADCFSCKAALARISKVRP